MGSHEVIVWLSSSSSSSSSDSIIGFIFSFLSFEYVAVARLS